MKYVNMHIHLIIIFTTCCISNIYANQLIKELLIRTYILYEVFHKVFIEHLKNV